MLKKVYPVTSGDWVVVELNNGRRYRLSGLSIASLAISMERAMQNASVIDELVDRSTSVPDGNIPWIAAVGWLADGNVVDYDLGEGAKFSLTLDETKTILSSSRVE